MSSPGRSPESTVLRGRGAGQLDEDWLAQIGAVLGARREVLRAEQCLVGGCLQGYLFGVLGRKACAARGAVGGCGGDGAPRREAHGLGAVSRDFQPPPWPRRRPADVGPLLAGGMLPLGCGSCPVRRAGSVAGR